jgi:ABC-type molybdate transport system substrate-binding protein
LELPEGMGSLEVINLTNKSRSGPKPTLLLPGWLPASSAARVRSLRAAFTDLRSVPSGMQALEVLDVGQCNHLAGDSLPECSRGRICTLTAFASSVRCIPAASACCRI